MIEFALTIAIGFHFLARRYGVWVGLVDGRLAALACRDSMARRTLIDTDTPGLLLWAATALAFWKGLDEPRARGWRIVVGILLGLAFIEKLSAVMVLVPLLLWMIGGHLPRRSVARGCGSTGSTVCSRPRRCWLRWRWHSSRSRSCSSGFPPPISTDLFVDRPASDWSGRHSGRSTWRVAVQATARAIVSQEPVMGDRAAGTRNLDGDSGVCPGRGLAG